MAPADGVTLSGVVTLEVRGSGIENVELLPGEGYAPRVGVFTVSADKTSAQLNFDTRTIPNIPAQLRISAFNVPAGVANAREIIVMPARTWRFSNDPEPFGTQNGRALACGSRGYTDPNDSLPVVCINGIPTDPPIPYEQCTGRFETGFSDPSSGLMVLRNGTRVNARWYCNPPGINGIINPECVCLQ